MSVLKAVQKKCEDMVNHKKALVTGSSRGIGSAIAKRLALDGIEVVVHGNQNAEAAEGVVKEIVGTGGKASFVLGDLSRADAIPLMFNQLGESVRELDILVNNAGILRGGALASLSLQEIESVLSVNITSLLVTTQEYHILFRFFH